MVEQPASAPVSGTVLLTVHGPGGAVDLRVPRTASPVDLATAYAQECGLGVLPQLVTTDGATLGVASSLGASGIRSGDLVIATDDVRAAEQPGESPAVDRGGVGRWRPVPGTLLVGLAGVLALGSGVVAAGLTVSWLHIVTVGILLLGAVLGAVPVGPRPDERAAVVPVFAAAAAYAVVGSQPGVGPEVTLAVAGLVAAGGSAAARAAGAGLREVHAVWIVTGAVWFLVPAAQIVLGMAPQVSWALLVLLAALAVRFVPGLAVDVPEQMLLDLDRLAVNAWSAHQGAPRSRARMMVPKSSAHAIMVGGFRTVHAASAAVAVTMALAAPALLATVTASLDRIGALVLLFSVGALVLLAARNFRHLVAQSVLRVAGLVCWAAVAGSLVATGGGALWWVVAGCLVLGPLLFVVAVARGRGWRSVWWSRRAEIAETLSGVAAVASLIVATGLFRLCWEWASGLGG